MNEFELISRLTASLPANPSVVVGPGDDCAVLDVGIPGRELLFKTDAVVEGVHFVPGAPPQQVGHKAMGRCLSDIAAMGGVPGSAVITLGLPAGGDPDWPEQAYEGIRSLAEKYKVAIVGGETTISPERVFLSVSMLGFVKKGRAIRRSGAMPGDAIFVSGELGGSLEGKHLEFEPRLAEAQWLCTHFDVHAMIDVSDGLAGDLRHILNASRTGAELLADAIPVSRTAKLVAKQKHDTAAALTAALTDGEDFELLFTVAPSDAVALLDRWKIAFPGTRLSCVGKMTRDQGLHMRDKRGSLPLTVQGYSHPI